jgi:hypothetical protein
MRYSAITFYLDSLGRINTDYHQSKNVVDFIGVRTLEEVKMLSGYKGTTEDEVDFYDMSESTQWKKRFYYLFVIPETSPIFNLYKIVESLPLYKHKEVEAMFVNVYSKPLIERLH